MSGEFGTPLQSLIGSTLMVGFDGSQVTPQIRRLIEYYKVGSILLSEKNFSSAEQATSFIKELQEIAYNAGHKDPLLIAVDQENGGNNSIFDNENITLFPSAMGVAATGKPAMARDVSRATAKEIACCGVNWILGPVLDVLSNTRSLSLGVRALGDDADLVRQYGLESLRGYHEGGLATCGKHFPSFGKLEFVGPSSGTPIVSETMEQLKLGPLVPFKAAIDAGLDAIMIGCCPMPRFEDGDVQFACLSSRIVNELLRKELGFDGIVLSECLEIEPLHDTIGVGQAAVMGISAGCDILTVCHSYQSQVQALTAIRSAIDSGMITMDQIQTAANRVSAVKKRWTSWEQALGTTGTVGLQSLLESHRNLSDHVYSHSIKVTRDKACSLPLGKSATPDQRLVLFTPLIEPLQSPHLNSLHEAEPGFGKDGLFFVGEATFHTLGIYMARRWPGKVLHVSYTASGLRPLHEELLSQAAAVVVVTAEAVRNTYQYGFAKLISMLASQRAGQGEEEGEESAAGIPCVMVAVSSPYDFLTDSQIPTYICTYDYTEKAFETLVGLLFDKCHTAPPTSPSIESTDDGSRLQALRKAKTIQKWLVEEYVPDRDLPGVLALLERCRDAVVEDYNKPSNALFDLAKRNFVIRCPWTVFNALVVRNSSTNAIYGICIYSVTHGISTGNIDLILVDHHRRACGVASSLHRRVVGLLTTHDGLSEIGLGSYFVPLFPNFFNKKNENRRKSDMLGWKTHSISQSCPDGIILTIKSLQTWNHPPTLYKDVQRQGGSFDILKPSSHAEMREHLDVCAPPSAAPKITTFARLLYEEILTTTKASNIIVKRDRNGLICASMILYNRTSPINDLFPLEGERPGGGVSLLTRPGPDQVDHAVSLLVIALFQLKTRGYTQVQLYVKIPIPEQQLAMLGVSDIEEYPGLCLETVDKLRQRAL